MGEPDESEIPDVSNRLVTPFRDYWAELLGRPALEAHLRASGLTWEELDDPSGWLTPSSLAVLSEHVMSQLYGSDFASLPRNHPIWQHSREIAHRTLQPRYLGASWAVLRALGSPRLFYRQVPRLARSANRTQRIEIVSDEPGRAVLRVIERARAHPSICWNRIGLFEAAPTVWGLPRARVIHRECRYDAVHPAPCCVYEVHYAERALTDLLGPVLGLGGGAGAGMAAAWLAGVGMALPAALGGLLAVALLAWMRLSALRASLDRGRVQIVEILEESDRRQGDLLLERRELRRALLAARNYSAYLPSDLVEQLAEGPAPEPGGQRVSAAVLFADLVGFTARSESMDPGDVLAELNAWFRHVDPIIARHGGAIDKRMGDSVMVVFVDRSGGEDLAGLHRESVRCGLEILGALDRCNRELTTPLSLRAGVAVGHVVRGNIGSEIKYEYTVIGDVVNLASRLEHAANPGCLLTLDLSGLQGIGEEVGRRVIEVRGRRQPVAVLELRPDEILRRADEENSEVARPIPSDIASAGRTANVQDGRRE